MISSGVKSGDDRHLIVISDDLKLAIQQLDCDQYFKVAYDIAWGTMFYDKRAVAVQGAVLSVSNKRRSVKWQGTSLPGEGRYCVFSQRFIDLHDRGRILNLSTLFNEDVDTVFYLDADQQKRVKEIFHTMKEELDSDYIFRHDLVFNYLHILIHESVKMHPAEVFETHQISAIRIYNMFQSLLENQFPIEPTKKTLQLRTPAQYASALHIHTNYLNAVVKEITGKTTSACIGEFIAKEARRLLQETTHSISEIAYALGFGYPSYFNKFFKKATGTTPGVFR